MATTRNKIGLCALLLLAATGVAYVIPMPMVAGSLLRVGIVMSLMWLAHPALQRIPTQIAFPAAILALLVAARPKLILLLMRVAVVLLPALLVIWWLWPSSRAASSTHSKR